MRCYIVCCCLPLLIALRSLLFCCCCRFCCLCCCCPFCFTDCVYVVTRAPVTLSVCWITLPLIWLRCVAALRRWLIRRTDNAVPGSGMCLTYRRYSACRLTPRCNVCDYALVVVPSVVDWVDYALPRFIWLLFVGDWLVRCLRLFCPSRIAVYR